MGWHFFAKTIAIKIMCARYLWPMLFNDSYFLVKACKECQFFTRRRNNSAMPLNLIVVDEPFTQWGLEFIGMINPSSSAGDKWILMANDYFTRWTEAKPLKNVIEAEIVEFLEELVTRFSPPKTIISNNAKAFLGSKICQFILTHAIFFKTSSNYYL